MTDDAVVVELIFRLKQSRVCTSPHPAAVRLLHICLPSSSWGHHQRRLKPTTLTSRKEAAVGRDLVYVWIGDKGKGKGDGERPQTWESLEVSVQINSKFFNSQGYLVLESFSSAEEIESMRKRMEELLDTFDCSSTASIFSTRNQQHTSDNFFFESADKVSFFFEEKAFGDDGNLKQPKHLSINKVGHALDEIDPVFKKFSSTERMSGLLQSLGYHRPVVIQSMYIFKQPGIGGEVVPHQDNSFLHTEPRTCTGLWLALEDATVINGCLWAIPGSHKNGLVRRFIRDENGVHFDNPSPLYDQKDFVPIEVKAGTLVVIHGDLIHQSFENQSEKSRHAYSLHVVDTVGCKWSEDNWSSPYAVRIVIRIVNQSKCIKHSRDITSRQQCSTRVVIPPGQYRKTE
nr:phytanoyl-CoA dioxygenase [Ipomoea batatas]